MGTRSTKINRTMSRLLICFPPYKTVVCLVLVIELYETQSSVFTHYKLLSQCKDLGHTQFRLIIVCFCLQITNTRTIWNQTSFIMNSNTKSMSEVCLPVYMHHMIRVAYKHYGNNYVKNAFYW